MNTLFFSAAAFAFLFSIEREKTSMAKVLEETFMVFSCVALIAATGLKNDLAVWIIPAVFAACSLACKPLIFFAAICGLSFSFLETAPYVTHLSGILQSAVLFAGLRIFVEGFRQRGLFFRPPSRFAGIPALLMQAFWASLFLSAWLLLPYWSRPAGI